MASSTYTQPTSYSPSATMSYLLQNMLRSGAMTPGSTIPNYRASTVATSNSNTATFSHTLSGNIVAGDMLIIALSAQSTAVMTAPTGWMCISCQTNSGNTEWVFCKVAVSGDIGAVTSWTLSTANNVAAISFAIQNAAHLSQIIASAEGTATTTTTVSTSVIAQGVPNCLQISLCFAFGGTGANSVTNPSTSIGSAQEGTGGTGILVGAAYQTQAAAGNTTAVSFTLGSAPSTARCITLIIAPNPNTGTVPAGGWTYVQEWALNTGSSIPVNTPSYMHSVWKSPAASNNINSDFYLVFTAGPNQSNANDSTFGLAIAEGYNTSTFTLTGFAANNANINTNAVPSGSTTPPWAHSSGLSGTGVTLNSLSQGATANAVNRSYFVTGNQGYPIQGTNQLLVVANADGFCYSIQNTSNANGNTVYAGGLISLVQNPNLPNPDICIGLGCPNIATYSTSGANNTGSTTRDYCTNITNATTTPFSYASIPYRIYTGSDSTYYGTVNGTAGTNLCPDLYAYPANNNPVFTRMCFTKAPSVTISRFDLAGGFRCLYPNWILGSLNATGMSWGDTFTIGTDTYQVGCTTPATACYIDTNA